jgi:predicted nuclease of predicted toxin-antitoxin system
MRILADENMPDQTVELLRMAGHDVHFVKETMPSEADPNILAVATRENRLLVTQDKDFGDIVVNRNQSAPCGVVLFRLHKDIPEDDQFRLMARTLDARHSWGPGIWAVSVRHPTTS